MSAQGIARTTIGTCCRRIQTGTCWRQQGQQQGLVGDVYKILVSYIVTKSSMGHVLHAQYGFWTIILEQDFNLIQRYNRIELARPFLIHTISFTRSQDSVYILNLFTAEEMFV